MLRHESRIIHSEIAEVLVALQFQDRVSQVLTHVQNELAKLEQRLARYSRQAATAEQHALHQGTGHGALAGSSITFF